jgi:hypothetical protein
MGKLVFRVAQSEKVTKIGSEIFWLQVGQYIKKSGILADVNDTAGLDSAVSITPRVQIPQC